MIADGGVGSGGADGGVALDGRGDAIDGGGAGGGGGRVDEGGAGGGTGGGAAGSDAGSLDGARADGPIADGSADRSGDSAGDAGPTACSTPPDAGAPAALVVLGDPCDSSGALACDGANPKISLICDLGRWQMLLLCASDQGCDRSSGVCAPLVAGCVGHAPGFSFCQGDILQTCGPDLVSAASTTCCGRCDSGACQAAACGNGRLEPGEECDDGNPTPADGCEVNCKRSTIVALSAGMTHTCALLGQGLVRCWGGNAQGQLGLGTSADLSAHSPYQNGVVALSAPAAAIATGASHSCALMVDGSVRCWGANGSGQLGLGHTRAIGDDEMPDAPTATVGLGAKAIAIAAGGNVSCAIMQDGSLRCWGQNDFGQLGLGHTRTIGDDELPSAAAAQVILDGTVRAVGPGGDHTCAVMDSNLIRCWGRNDLSQLGLGTTANIGDDEPPTAVAAISFPGATPFLSIGAGQTRSFALMDEALRGWGDNSDNGLGVDFPGAQPTLKATDWGDFSFQMPLVEASVGGLHVCLRFQANKLRCWGRNDQAQLGLSDTMILGDFEPVTSRAPIDFGLAGDGTPDFATTVAAGALHTCALLNSNGLRCWGYNADGQLGLGYASRAPALDYVGGTVDTTPGKLPAVQVFPPSN